MEFGPGPAARESGAADPLSAFTCSGPRVGSFGKAAEASVAEAPLRSGTGCSPDSSRLGGGLLTH